MGASLGSSNRQWLNLQLRTGLTRWWTRRLRPAKQFPVDLHERSIRPRHNRQPYAAVSTEVLEEEVCRRGKVEALATKQAYEPDGGARSAPGGPAGSAHGVKPRPAQETGNRLTVRLRQPPWCGSTGPSADTQGTAPPPAPCPARPGP